MIKKDYKFLGSVRQIEKLRDLLKSNFLTFTVVFWANDCYNQNGELILSFNISLDFVSEVDELVKECAEKTGVKVV